MPEIIPDGLPYTPRGIECLRFGARRGGEGIGCCAVDVFQGFSNDPKAQRPPIPFFDGDSRTPIIAFDGTQIHVTGTNEEVFLSYLVHGSFTNCPTSDHAFIAILTEEQVDSEPGQEWLRILKREGFKWVATTSNGVYGEYHPNYIFILVRTTHESLDDDEIEMLNAPPKGWEELPTGKDPETRWEELKKITSKTLKSSAELSVSA